MSWFYRGDLRCKGEQGWSPYEKDESDKIERSYQKGKKEVKLNDKYKINIEGMYQFRTSDESKQREVRRDAAKTKKAKVESNGLIGRKVWVVTHVKESECSVLGVFSNIEDARKKKSKKQAKGITEEINIFEKSIQ